MGVGQIAGLIAAIAFAVLAGFMIYPLIRLGKLFDQIADTVRESGEHAIPALDEGVTTVKQVNRRRGCRQDLRDRVVHRQQRRRLTDLYGSFLNKARHQDRVVLLCAEIHRRSFVARAPAVTPSKAPDSRESKAQ